MILSPIARETSFFNAVMNLGLLYSKNKAVTLFIIKDVCDVLNPDSRGCLNLNVFKMYITWKCLYLFQVIFLLKRK